MMRLLQQMKGLGCLVGCGFLLGCVPVTGGDTREPESTMTRDSENYLEAEDAH